MATAWGISCCRSFAERARQHNLPRQTLLNMIEARIFDLYDDVFENATHWKAMQGRRHRADPTLQHRPFTRKMPQEAPKLRSRRRRSQWRALLY